MKPQQWTFINKSAWGHGPWDDEPDLVQWFDEATGLCCLAARNPLGSWCGYVCVPKTHPWHEKRYQDVPDVDVHGGLTYSAAYVQDGEGTHHVGAPQGFSQPWWFGFDCAHWNDLSPELELMLRRSECASQDPPTDVYRDLAYVRAECTRLAAQLAQVHAGHTP